jgi:NADPH-dependent 2,4-dienoyl-CoA reductase/sulfur reductase-like enzyme/rhodanese-related sulfurtransferase
MTRKRIVIVGGVAGGASAATCARRLSEEAEIILFERGPHVSFANCGLPYYIGGEIEEKDELLVQTPQSLHTRYNLDVRVDSTVTSIDRDKKRVEFQNSGKTCFQDYDELILSTGAAPLKPPIPGIGREGHFTVRNILDVEEITSWVEEKNASRAVVIGGGYIGLEMVEQLHRRGLKTVVAEALPQVMGPLDEEMAAWLHHELRANGITLCLGNPVAGFEPPGEGETAAASMVLLKSGTRLPADIVILGMGVKPEVSLAREAGLEIGSLGGIRVNESLQTSDPHIWAIGDVIEVRHGVSGEWTLLPLAGPANRQGRIVAENIFGQKVKYPGSWGTAILRLFDLSAGCTGINERTLHKMGKPYEVAHLHPYNHADYYPGASRMALKIIFEPETGKLLGAQAVAKAGVDKRIDVLATALKAGMTVHDLADLELSYAPPFGSAKDPVNLAGMVAGHVLNGEIRPAQWHEIPGLDLEKTILLDVRQDSERREGFIPGSLHIPLDQIRERAGELARDCEIIPYCFTGQRSYFACRILSQLGFRVRNLMGSYRTWKAVQK